MNLWTMARLVDWYNTQEISWPTEKTLLIKAIQARFQENQGLTLSLATAKDLSEYIYSDYFICNSDRSFLDDEHMWTGEFYNAKKFSLANARDIVRIFPKLHIMEMKLVF